MKHLEKSLEALRAYLDATPQAEVAALIAKIDQQAYGGPTVDQYLTQLDDALRMDSWLDHWPAAAKRPEGNWGFQKLIKVKISSDIVAYPSPSRLENGDDFLETSVCEAA
jgi:hypothetical protein